MAERNYPIIDASAKRSKFLVWAEKFFMFVATLFLWWFLLNHIAHKLFAPSILEKTLAMFAFLLVVTIGQIILLGLWQVYNKLLYSGATRRKALFLPEDGAMASIYKIEVSSLAKLRQAPRVNLRYTDGQYYLATSEASYKVGVEL